MTSPYWNQELLINLPETTLRLLEQRARKHNFSPSQYGLSLIVKSLMAEEYTDLAGTASGLTDTRNRNRGR